MLKWDKALSWLKEILDQLCPYAILFFSFFSVLMHFQHTTVLCYSPIKAIIEGSAHEKGKYDSHCKKTVIFFFMAD